MSRKSVFLAIAFAVLAGCGGSGDSFNRVWGAGEAGLVDGNAETARFANPANVEVGPDGTVYVADYDNDAVRVVSTGGQVSTLVHQAGFAQPFGLAFGGGLLYVETDRNPAGVKDSTTGTVWAVNPSTGVVSVVAQNLGRPRGLLVLLDGRIALSDLAHHVISILDPLTGAVTPLAGGFDQPGFVNSDTGADARFSRPYGMALDDDGSILVADQDNNVIRRVSLSGVVSTWAGTGAVGSGNGAQLSATFNRPQDIAKVGGKVFIDDHDNHLMRQVSGGNVSTFAGDGLAGFIDATGTLAEFFGQEGIALNADGSVLWIADGNNGMEPSVDFPYNRVRRLRTQ
jgi:sugar lactone lactonase YvrE